MKKQIDEKQLLADAKLWFTKKHGASPKECNIKFIKIWHKPTLFRTTTAVVFAQTEEAGKAFIWEQNAIWRSGKYFWLVPVLFTVALFATFSQKTPEAMINIAIHFISISFLMFLCCLYFAKKCKKLEKIHQWNVDIYYA